LSLSELGYRYLAWPDDQQGIASLGHRTGWLSCN
jgi:hypothetical protein